VILSTIFLFLCIFISCNCFVNSVRNREPTARQFTLENVDISKWKESGRTKKRVSSVASGTRNSASGTRKQTGKTTPAEQLSSEPPDSQVTRSKSTLSSRGAGRKEVNKSVNSSGISHRSSAVSAGLSEDTDRVSHRTESKAGLSASHADSGTPESTSVAGASRNEITRTGASSSNSRSHKHHNSASNALSSDNAERGKDSAKSQPELSAATTTRSTHSSSITVPSGKSSAPGNEETAGTVTGSLHHKAASESGFLLTRSRKYNLTNKKVAESAKDKSTGVHLGGDAVPDRSVVHSSHLVQVEETAIRSTTATGGNAVGNRSSSADVAPSSSETVANQQASSVTASVTTTASVDVMASGKTVVTNHSNTTSTRTRSATQSRPTSSRTQTASSAKAVGSSDVSDAANVDVVASGVSTVTSRSTAAGSKTQSVSGGRQISAADVAAAVATAMR